MTTMRNPSRVKRVVRAALVMSPCLLFVTVTSVIQSRFAESTAREVVIWEKAPHALDRILNDKHNDIAVLEPHGLVYTGLFAESHKGGMSEGRFLDPTHRGNDEFLWHVWRQFERTRPAHPDDVVVRTKDGNAFQLLKPVYYRSSCLACHEGAREGQLAAVGEVTVVPDQMIGAFKKLGAQHARFSFWMGLVVTGYAVWGCWLIGGGREQPFSDVTKRQSNLPGEQ